MSLHTRDLHVDTHIHQVFCEEEYITEQMRMAAQSAAWRSQLLLFPLCMVKSQSQCFGAQDAKRTYPRAWSETVTR
eukprot:g83273.t1